MTDGPERNLYPLTSAGLFEALQHGDENHRAWLKAALEAYFQGLPPPPIDEKPPVKFLGRKETLRAYSLAEGSHYEKLKALQRAVLNHNGLKAV